MSAKAIELVQHTSHPFPGITIIESRPKGIQVLKTGTKFKMEGKLYEVIRAGEGSAFVRAIDKLKREANVYDKKTRKTKTINFEVPDKGFLISLKSMVEIVEEGV